MVDQNSISQVLPSVATTETTETNENKAEAMSPNGCTDGGVDEKISLKTLKPFLAYGE